MSRIEERLKKSVQKTAEKTKQAVKKALPSNPQSAKHVAIHRHCNVCQTPIHIDSDPPVCEASECRKEWSKRESSRKRLNIMLYLFPAIAIMLVLLQGFL